MLVLDLGIREVAEQFADRGVLAAGSGAAVEALGLGLHAFREVAHCIEAEGLHLPDRLVRMKPRTSWRRISGMCSPNFSR